MSSQEKKTSHWIQIKNAKSDGSTWKDDVEVLVILLAISFVLAVLAILPAFSLPRLPGSLHIQHSPNCYCKIMPPLPSQLDSTAPQPTSTQDNSDPLPSYHAPFIPPRTRSRPAAGVLNSPLPGSLSSTSPSSASSPNDLQLPVQPPPPPLLQFTITHVDAGAKGGSDSGAFEWTGAGERPTLERGRGGARSFSAGEDGTLSRARGGGTGKVMREATFVRLGGAVPVPLPELTVVSPAQLYGSLLSPTSPTSPGPTPTAAPSPTPRRLFGWRPTPSKSSPSPTAIDPPADPESRPDRLAARSPAGPRALSLPRLENTFRPGHTRMNSDGAVAVPALTVLPSRIDSLVDSEIAGVDMGGGMLY
ncbi:hypothetical protein BDK51DRAFT_39039 [Blyttiomyces helicus]|uniref:Uncharacterized protein n=1 Tax=Blyttiomyces helicus TaxID=388810 RepID=A0A4P9W314_9FUNG|nr:hypothetical protein BDK51DRAFT_39039 [Blyttiomyces helicus]|eukprot:RKO85583.1 hypothetical protein BDK51DRAFT_39039 [Blyttiomyces helicus]